MCSQGKEKEDIKRRKEEDKKNKLTAYVGLPHNEYPSFVIIRFPFGKSTSAVTYSVLFLAAVRPLLPGSSKIFPTIQSCISF